MKILISHDGSPAHFFIRLGLAKAWEHCGHQVGMWDIKSKPAYDMFDEFQPDLFWGQTYNLNDAIISCIADKPHMKVVLRASDWGEAQKSIDLTKYPILTANEGEINLVRKLIDETGKPDFVHCHYHSNRILNTHGYWADRLGIKVVGLISAADIFDYTGGKKLPEFECDLAFVGGYWGYKGQTLSKYIMRLCQVGRPYKIKIYGNQPWGCPQYCGNLPTEFVKHALASATICPNISEPHSQEFGYDIVERPFKLLANKCFCISDYVDSMAKDVFKDNEIVFAHTPIEFEALVSDYLNHPEMRDEYIARGYNTVMNGHTYFHRIQTVFEELNLKNEAMRVGNMYNGLKSFMAKDN